MSSAAVLPQPDERQPVTIGSSGRFGQTLPGGPSAPQAVFAFREVDVPSRGEVPFELRLGIERSEAIVDNREVLTEMSLEFVNRDNRQAHTVSGVFPENNRTFFFSVPSSVLQGGNFDVIARVVTPDHWVGVQQTTLGMVASTEPFIFNLFKSLLVMWLMTLLVVSISIFCSVFLSWPIAVVLTIVLLLGRWLVLQLQDSIQPGMGAQVATDLGFANPNTARAVSASVDALARMLNTLAGILPDISRFAAIDQIEKGLVVPLAVIAGSGEVLLVFALPLVVLAYVVLRYKEVAP